MTKEFQNVLSQLAPENMRETVCHVYVLSAFQYNVLAEPSIWRVHNISRNCTRFNHYGLSAQKECSLFLNSETYYNRGRIILGDPGAVNWVRTNEGQSFQEQVREALGCDSYRTSLSTHSIIVSDWAQKIFLCSIRGQLLSRCFRYLPIRRSLPLNNNSNVRRICLVRAGELSSRRVFSENET